MLMLPPYQSQPHPERSKVQQCCPHGTGMEVKCPGYSKARAGRREGSRGHLSISEGRRVEEGANLVSEAPVERIGASG